MTFETWCSFPAPALAALLPERSLTAGFTAPPQNHRSSSHSELPSSHNSAGHMAELTTSPRVSGWYRCSGKGDATGGQHSIAEATWRDQNSCPSSSRLAAAARQAQQLAWLSGRVWQPPSLHCPHTPCDGAGPDLCRSLL